MLAKSRETPCAILPPPTLKTGKGIYDKHRRGYKYCVTTKTVEYNNVLFLLLSLAIETQPILIF